MLMHDTNATHTYQGTVVRLAWCLGLTIYSLCTRRAAGVVSRGRGGGFENTTTEAASNRHSALASHTGGKTTSSTTYMYI